MSEEDKTTASAKVKNPKKETMQSFTNTGKRNVFTEKGRVMPGCTVSLLPSVAKLYETLKRKQASK